MSEELDPMPVFVIKAKDEIAILALQEYAMFCVQKKLYHQARQVQLAIEEMVQWRSRNRHLVKPPHHDHVPVGVQMPEQTFSAGSVFECDKGCTEVKLLHAAPQKPFPCTVCGRDMKLKIAMQIHINSPQSPPGFSNTTQF